MMYLAPIWSNAFVRMSRRSVYSFNWTAKKSCFLASLRPVATASWSGPLVQKTIRVDAANVGVMIDEGPINQPTLQPVAANASTYVTCQEYYVKIFSITHFRPIKKLRCVPTCQVTLQCAHVHHHRILSSRTCKFRVKCACFQFAFALTTSSAKTSKLNSLASAAIPSSSFLVNTFPTGLWGVLTIIIFAFGVIARLRGKGISWPSLLWS